MSMTRWTGADAVLATPRVPEPLPASFRTTLLARVFRAVNEIVVATPGWSSPEKSWKAPSDEGVTAVTFPEMAFAVAGTPHCPVIVKMRWLPGGMAGPP